MKNPEATEYCKTCRRRQPARVSSKDRNLIVCKVCGRALWKLTRRPLQDTLPLPPPVAPVTVEV